MFDKVPISPLLKNSSIVDVDWILITSSLLRKSTSSVSHIQTWKRSTSVGKSEAQPLDFAGENAWEPELILNFKWKIARQKWGNLGSFFISSSFWTNNVSNSSWAMQCDQIDGKKMKKSKMISIAVVKDVSLT